MDTQITLAKKRQNFTKILEKQKDEIVKVMPSFMSPTRLLRIAQTAALTQPKLFDCSPASIGLSLMKCAERGLEPDGYYAHLIPFRDHKSGQMHCQLIWDYKGLAQLAYNSGIVVSISTEIVYEDEAKDPDRFSVTLGTNRKIDHKFDILHALNSQRKPVGVYCVVELKNGSTKFEIMPWNEILEIAKRSKTYNKQKDSWFGPWATDFNEMAKKTVFKRMSKLLPLSNDFKDAISDDNKMEFGAEDLPDVESKMKAAEPVIEEPTTQSGEPNPFDQALDEETKTATTEPKKEPQGSTETVEAPAQATAEKTPVKEKRFRRTQLERDLCGKLEVIFEERGWSKKDLVRFGVEDGTDLLHCRYGTLQLIERQIIEEDAKEAPDPTEPETVEVEKEPSVDDAMGVGEPKSQPPVAVDAEKILAITSIRERIESYSAQDCPINEDDVIRYAQAKHDAGEAKTLNELDKSLLNAISYIFEDIYKWVQENPEVNF